MIYGAARGGFDNLFQMLGLDRIFLVGELQNFYLVNHGSGSPGQLLGHVPAFESRRNVKAVLADYAGYLLDREIGVAAQAGDVATIVLVGKHESRRVSRSLEGSIHAARSLFKFLPRRQILAVNRRSIFENLYDRFQVAGMIRCWDRGCSFHFSRGPYQ